MLALSGVNDVVGVAKLIILSGMTQYEALKLSGGLIESLELAGVDPGDHKYLRMFEDYREAERRGEKVVYAVACLAAKYGVSERTVYSVVKRLGRDCKTVSVGSSGKTP